MRYGYIYKITSPTGRIYVGKTINLNKRLKSYELNPNKQQRFIYASLVKYGYFNHKIEIVKEGLMSDNLLSRYEIYFIKHFNSYYYNNKKFGMNLTLGGDGTNGMRLSKSSISKMIYTKKHTPPTEKEIALREKLRKMKLGNPLPKTREWLRNNGLANRIPILQYGLDGKFIREWSGAIEVEGSLGFSRKAIVCNLKHKTKMSCGFIWRYTDDNSELDLNINKFKGLKRKVLNTETNHVFDSIKDAALSVGVKPGCIQTFLLGHIKHKKYPFVYAEQ